MELQALVLNINEGYNVELKEQCHTLKEYMQYVDLVREYTATMPMAEAVDRAVDECISGDILRDFLLANKAEVKRMSIFEYDEEAVSQAMHKAGYAEGREEGRAESVIKLLERHEFVSKQMQDAILREPDIEVLDGWFELAVSTDSLEEWKRMVHWQE